MKMNENMGQREDMHCDLCGSMSPVVRCEKCNNQMFCLSCDNMYHRHPKRQTHVRKAAQPASFGVPYSNHQLQGVRPPLPPKAETLSPPVPPPRKNKRIPGSRMLGGSPFGRREFGFMEQPGQRKEWSLKEKMGNFKRLVKKRSPSPENMRDDFRPVPPPISTIPRPQNSMMESSQYPHIDNRFRKFSHGAMSEKSMGSLRRDNIPVTVLEMSSRAKSRVPSSSQSVFNLSDNGPSRRYPDPEVGYPRCSRAGSFSNSDYLGQFEVYPDNSDMGSVHGFSTMSRPRRTPDVMRPDNFSRGNIYSSSCWDLKAASMGVPYPNMPPVMWGGYCPPQNYMGAKEGMKRAPSAMSINVPMSDDIPMMCYPPQYNMWGAPHPQMYPPPYGMSMYPNMGHPYNDLNLSNQSLNTKEPKKSKSFVKSIPSRFRSKKKPTDRLHRSLSHIPMEISEKRSTDSEDFYSADQSDEEERHYKARRAPSEPAYSVNQCQYCTFINPADCRVCKMCSKTMHPVFTDTLVEEAKDVDREVDELTPAIKSSLILGGSNSQRDNGDMADYQDANPSRPRKGVEVVTTERPASPFVRSGAFSNSMNNSVKVSSPHSTLPTPQYVQVQSFNETLSDVDSQSVTVAQLAVSITKKKEESSLPDREMTLLSGEVTPLDQREPTPPDKEEACTVVNGLLTPAMISQGSSTQTPTPLQVSEDSQSFVEPIEARVTPPLPSEPTDPIPTIVHVKTSGNEISVTAVEHVTQTVSAGTDASGNLAEKVIIPRPYQSESNKVTTGTSPPPQSISTQTADYSELDLKRAGPHSSMLVSPSLENKFIADKNMQDFRREGIRRDIKYPRENTILDSSFPSDPTLREIPFANETIMRTNQFPPEQNMRGFRYQGDVPQRDLSYIPQNEPDIFPYRLPEERPGFNGLEELILRRKQDDLRRQGYELTMLLREAEMNNMTAEDVEVALTHCGSLDPIRWFKENWRNLVETVVALGNNQSGKNGENYVGKLSFFEAETALRKTKGNVWAAVTLAVKERQQKIAEIRSRGPFELDEITSLLSEESGDLEKAYHNLTKNHFKPFCMKIWGPPNGIEAESRLDHHDNAEYRQQVTGLVREDPMWRADSETQFNRNSAALLEHLEQMRDIDRVKELLREQLQTDRSEVLDNDQAVALGNTHQLHDDPSHLGNASAGGEGRLETVYVATTEPPVMTEVRHPEEEAQVMPVPTDLPNNPAKDQDISGPIQETVQNDVGTENGRRVRQLLGEGKVKSYEQGEMVVKLRELDFSEDLAISASEECGSLYSAIKFLRQECEICANFVPAKEMISMLNCTHKCCIACARVYFESVIKEKHIMNAVCISCDEPNLNDLEVAQSYFNHLDILLKSIVDQEIHELFHRKLRDWTLQQDPNFKWCIKCSFGFIAEVNENEVVCPNCEVSFCRSCQKLWEPQHEKISCEKFQEWKQANDPELQQQGVERQLEENGIDCPRCKFRFLLAKGGCMHFTCMQCKFEFCSGCGMPFKMGAKCGRNQYCVKLGLHAHHPRNCLFYLRDKNVDELRDLLDNNGIHYDIAPSGDTGRPVKCPVQEQKDGPNGLYDDICGKLTEENQAGLCRVHFIEYLSGLINKHNLDPINIFPAGDLELILRRSDVKLPPKSPNEAEDVYRNKLLNVINELLPLGSTETLPQFQEITPIEIAPGETAF